MSYKECRYCGSRRKPVVIQHAQYCQDCGQKIVDVEQVRLMKRPTMDIRAPRKPGVRRLSRTSQSIESTQPPISRADDSLVPSAPPIGEPTAAVHEITRRRVEAAKTVPRTSSVSRFHHSTPEDIDAARERIHAIPSLPHAAITHHEALSRIVQTLPAITREPLRRHRPSLRQMGAVTAVIVVMSTYIWLQNAPKLTVQSAANRAGVAASMPGYLPSSYHLADTKTAPGLVTVSFESPSADQPLIISQQQTTWDSRSLVENYISKQGSTYSSLTGEGLTVYFFGANQASWVNRGVWYSITGTGRLGRDQIMKIVYSL